MKMKTHLAIAGFILAFANLGSAKVEAAQSDLRTQCEPFAIKVSISLNEYASVDVEREELNEEAAERCYGHHFIIDNSSIERKRYMIHNTGFDPKFAVSVTAKVSCMNY